MKHALVTGGAGFIGSHLVERLLAEGWRVTVVDNFDPFYDPAIKRRNLARCAGEGFRLVEADLRDAGTLASRLDGSYDVIVHLAARAAAAALRVRRPDVILSLTTPPGIPVLGGLLARFWGARHYIWEMDLYPDVAVALGHLRSRSPVARVSGRLLDWARRRADGVIALGPCQRDRLLARGVPPQKVHVVENWADGEAIKPLARARDGRVTVLYSGNVGLAHGVETIGEVILALKGDERIRFVFAGGGAKRAELESFCQRHGLNNAQFRPYCPRERLGLSLAEGDVGLVKRRPRRWGAWCPAKPTGSWRLAARCCS